MFSHPVNQSNQSIEDKSGNAAWLSVIMLIFGSLIPLVDVPCTLQDCVHFHLENCIMTENSTRIAPLCYSVFDSPVYQVYQESVEHVLGMSIHRSFFTV